MLTVQRPLICAVIQDAIERTHATLMFSNAFLDTFDMLDFIREALVMAAEANDKAKDIHKCLLSDEEYNINMSWLVSF